MSNFFKIRFTGGLGDCLKMITEQTSLYQYYREKGLYIYWVYSDMNIVDMVYKQFEGSKILNGKWCYIRDYDKIEDYNKGNTNTVSGSYPVHQALYDLLKYFTFFELTDQHTFAELDVPELSNWRCNEYSTFQMDKQLKGLYSNEQGGWKIEYQDPMLHGLIDSVEHTFCFQLSGSNPAKKYDVEKYIKIFKMILDQYPSCRIFLIDQPNFVVDPDLLFDWRITNLIGKISMIQCAKVIQSVDYLVAPDSYSKYLRKWVNGKQTILCCNLDCHEPISMLQWAFHYVGLLNNKDVTLLGASYTIDNNVVNSATLVNYMNEISPEEIFNSIKL
jgi:hypothetical protein